MKCKYCGVEIGNSLECHLCGHKQIGKTTCPVCSKLIYPYQEYCSNCGSPTIYRKSEPIKKYPLIQVYIVKQVIIIIQFLKVMIIKRMPMIIKSLLKI